MNSTSSENAQSAAKSDAPGAINYDDAPLVEAEIDGVEYRIDAGKQGTALCISSRTFGSWDWSSGGEARWDGSMLRSKAFERGVLVTLASQLKEALAALQ